MKYRLSVRWKDMALLHGALVLYAAVSVFAKLAGIGLAAQERTKTLIFLALEAVTLAAYSMLWQTTLKRMPLHFAYSNKGVCTLWTFLFGVCLFGESLTWGKAIGLTVVLIGVFIVVTDHE